MQLFSKMYDKVIAWSRLPNAKWYLSGLSFAESSFFLVPPDVMLAPMSLATPSKAWHYALITTIASVLGGLFGYLIGMLAFDWIQPWLQQSHYWEVFEKSQTMFKEYGFWAIFIAGFSPIPYKIFTISAGAFGIALAPFALASLIGRGLRFYLVAGLMKWGGAPMEAKLKQYIDYIGWAVVLIALCAFVLLKL